MGPIISDLSIPPPPPPPPPLPSTSSSSSPPDDDNSDEMTLHGLNNGRSRYVQTILLGRTEIQTFLTQLHLPTPPTLPARIDIPRGLPFTAFLSARLHTPAAPMPARTRAWDIRMPLHWLYPSATTTTTTAPDSTLPPRKLWTTRLPPRRSIPETADAIAALLRRIDVAGAHLQFRGTTRWDVERAVETFGPARVEPTDLGPGVYTTGCLELAVAYAAGGGVVWVFLETAAAWRALKVARVEGGEWVWVASGRGGRAAEDGEDVLIGAVSDDRGPAGLQGCEEGRVDVVPMEGGSEWLCWRSRKAWRALGKGLVALVYLEEMQEVVYEGWTVAE